MLKYHHTKIKQGHCKGECQQEAGCKPSVGIVCQSKVVIKHHFKWFSHGRARYLWWKWGERLEEEKESTGADLEIVLHNRDWWGAGVSEGCWGRKIDAETTATNTDKNTRNKKETDQTVGLIERSIQTRESILTGVQATGTYSLLRCWENIIIAQMLQREKSHLQSYYRITWMLIILYIIY